MRLLLLSSLPDETKEMSSLLSSPQFGKMSIHVSTVFLIVDRFHFPGVNFIQAVFNFIVPCGIDFVFLAVQVFFISQINSFGERLNQTNLIGFGQISRELENFFLAVRHSLIVARNQNPVKKPANAVSKRNCEKWMSLFLSYATDGESGSMYI